MRWMLGHTCVILFLANGSTARGEEPASFRLVDTLLYGEVKPPIGNYVPNIAFSPDDKLLAVSYGSKPAILYHLAERRIVTTLGSRPRLPCRLTFSQTGKYLEYDEYGGKNPGIWDVTRGEDATKTAPRPKRKSITLSPDNQKIAGDPGYAIKFYDSFTGYDITLTDPFVGTPPHTDRGLYGPSVGWLSFSVDGKTLAIDMNYFDDELPRLERVQIWDLETLKLLDTFAGFYCNYMPDGKSLFSIDKHRLQFRNSRTLEVEWELEEESEVNRGASLSRDGKVLATGINWQNPKISIWDLSDRKRIAQLSSIDSRKLHTVGLSSDGKTVAAGTTTGVVYVWTRNGSKNESVSHRRAPTSKDVQCRENEAGFSKLKPASPRRGMEEGLRN